MNILSKCTFVFLASVLFPHISVAQLKVANTNFKVESQKFSPPVQDLIASFINKSTPAFQANDLNSISRSPSNYYGKSLVLFFWSMYDGISEEYIAYLNELNKELPDLKADLLTFGDESRSEIKDYVAKQNIQYAAIPNGKFLGEAIYGSELGTPRFFIIDKKGIIKYIIPYEASKNHTNTIATIKVYLTELVANN